MLALPRERERERERQSEGDRERGERESERERETGRERDVFVGQTTPGLYFLAKDGFDFQTSCCNRDAGSSVPFVYSGPCFLLRQQRVLHDACSVKDTCLPAVNKAQVIGGPARTGTEPGVSGFAFCALVRRRLVSKCVTSACAWHR